MLFAMQNGLFMGIRIEASPEEAGPKVLGKPQRLVAKGRFCYYKIATKYW